MVKTKPLAYRLLQVSKFATSKTKLKRKRERAEIQK